MNLVYQGLHFQSSPANHRVSRVPRLEARTVGLSIGGKTEFFKGRSYTPTFHNFDDSALFGLILENVVKIVVAQLFIVSCPIHHRRLRSKPKNKGRQLSRSRCADLKALHYKQNQD
jgi:hypothetical protein